MSVFNSNKIAELDTNIFICTFNQQVNLITTNDINLAETGIIPDCHLTFVNSSATNEMLIINIDPNNIPNFNTEVASVPVGQLLRDVIFKMMV